MVYNSSSFQVQRFIQGIPSPSDRYVQTLLTLQDKMRCNMADRITNKFGSQVTVIPFAE
jgi:hypothetical protein